MMQKREWKLASMLLAAIIGMGCVGILAQANCRCVGDDCYEDVIVSDSEEPGVNGTYRFVAFINGRPTYRTDDHHGEIFWDTESFKMWELSYSTLSTSVIVAWNMSGDHATPPSTGWQAQGQVPTFSGGEPCDIIPPVISCPIATTIEAGESEDPSNTGQATATDNSDPNPALSFVDSRTGGCPDVISRTWTASDESGNTSCIQEITVTDTAEPAIACPVDHVVVAGESSRPSDTGWATATDASNQKLLISYSDTEEGSREKLIHREWRATDSCGNSSACVQVIEVPYYLTIVPNGLAGPDEFLDAVLPTDDQSAPMMIGALPLSAIH